MITREAIEREYKVVNGVIEDPGKFEGDPVYAPYFWDIWLCGLADDDDGKVAGFDLTDGDRGEFPELQGFNRVELWEDDQGFIWTRKCNAKRD